jgi:phosphate:Na+ symporter
MLNGLLLFITGLAFFLFGMMKLSAAMQQLFGARIRNFIKFSVRNPFFGLLTGIGATVVFQSSSATTLLTVGIVSAGLISFYNSLGIILGADIGTTLTAQLVVWNVTALSPFIIFAGAMVYLSGREAWKRPGEMIIYFGLIFYGLSLVGDSTAPLKGNEWFLRFFRDVKNPLLGLGIGIVFTALVHASAIPISILIILGQQGFVSIENALPIVLGANVGTTATAIAGSLFMNVSGRRSAFAHLVFKCLGAGICLLLLPLVVLLLKSLSSDVSQQIAYGHVFVSLLIVVLFIFALKPFSFFIERILPGQDEALPLWPEYLDSRCLARAEDALECVKKELGREIMLARRMLEESIRLITNWREAKKRDVMYIELVVDNLQGEITNYLWNISCGRLSQELSEKLFAFSVVVYDIERIGDRSTNLVELAESRHKRNAIFSEQAQIELSAVGRLVLKNVDDAASLLEHKDRDRIREIRAANEEVRLKVGEATERHLERFYKRMCQAEAGPIFVDMLTNLQVISDHCMVIAEHIERLEEV